jgi:hypothetical protein
MAANAGLSAANVRACINDTALDLGTTGFDRSFGNGRIRAPQAVACTTVCTPTQTTETSCSDGLDNDCDGLIDGADPDCQSACFPAGATCTSNSDCCSSNCKGKAGSQTCK